MKNKIGIININSGNLYSIEKSLKFLEVNYIISSNISHLDSCERYILPGVGAFDNAMKNIKVKKLDNFIYTQVKKGKIILGICLGMQLLGFKSSEFGLSYGLNLNDLNYRPFNDKIAEMDFHIGFNKVKYPKDSKLFKNIQQNSDFYFLHGYCAKLKKEKKSYGITKYKFNFVSSYEKQNILGVQFHPEKSKINGIELIKNFINY